MEQLSIFVENQEKCASLLSLHDKTPKNHIKTQIQQKKNRPFSDSKNKVKNIHPSGQNGKGGVNKSLRRGPPEPSQKLTSRVIQKNSLKKGPRKITPHALAAVSQVTR